MSDVMCVFCLYDSKAEKFLPPFYAINHAVAIRRVIATCQDMDSDLARSAEDFTLFGLGTFDGRTGKFDLLDHLDNLGNVGPMRDKAQTVRVTKEPQA